MNTDKMLDMIKMEIKGKDKLIEELNVRIDMLQKALLVKTVKANGDIEIHGQDMEDMWNTYVEQMFDAQDKGIEDSDAEQAVYSMGTLHWNGYYCKVGCGASFGESFMNGLGDYCSGEVDYVTEKKEEN